MGSCSPTCQSAFVEQKRAPLKQKRAPSEQKRAHFRQKRAQLEQNKALLGQNRPLLEQNMESLSSFVAYLNLFEAHCCERNGDDAGREGLDGACSTYMQLSTYVKHILMSLHCYTAKHIPMLLQVPAAHKQCYKHAPGACST